MDSPFYNSVDKNYAFVPLAFVFSAFTVMSMGGAVMKARKECGVEYPNLYASVVKDSDGKVLTNAKSPALAEQFNAVQRGHQNTLEGHYAAMAMTIVAAQAYPLVASGALVAWSIGAKVYAGNYATKGAAGRNSNLALLKYVGLLTLAVSNLVMVYKLFTK